MAKYGIIVEIDRCVGCHACAVACKEENKVAPGIFYERIHRVENDKDMVINWFRVSCMHCEKPACMPICPMKAIHRGPAGEVLVDHEKCIGCQTCVQKCPFHAPAYNEEESKTYKCDGCIDRQKRGENPVCTIVCPSMNIAYSDDFEALLSQTADAKSIKDTVETKPNYGVVMDKDAELDMFTNIDGWTETIDRGGENY